jgi:hypothetical protein
MSKALSSEARQALEGSYEKWIKITEGFGIDKMGDNCPLCQLFFELDDKENPDKNSEEFYIEICRSESREECPISQYSGEGNCHKTPYYIWLDHQKRFHQINWERGNMRVKCPACKILAEDMVKFLDKVRESFKED